jgi:CRISPR type III-B/RAMP module-associated protein Cmr3
MLFRDGRPFRPDELQRARPVSLSPPQRTVFGTLRHSLLEAYGVTYDDFSRGSLTPEDAAVLGSPTHPGSLQIGPTFLAECTGRSVVAHLPFPADVVDVEFPRGNRAGFLMPRADDAIGNLPKNLLSVTAHTRDAAHNTWLPCPTRTLIKYETDGRLLPAAAEALGDYLCARGAEYRLSSEFLRPEPLTGIELQADTRRPNEGMLYVAEMMRPAFDEPTHSGLEHYRTGFVFDVFEGGSALPSSGTVALGGERRPFALTRWDADPWWSSPKLRDPVEGFLEDRCQRDGVLQFRLIFTSPAEAPDGWRLPLPRIEGIRFEIVAAVLPRAVWFSGWDLANRRPRDAFPHVPAGSVFFIRAYSETRPAPVKTILDRLWHKSVLDGEPMQAGLGFTLVGGWPYA